MTIAAAIIATVGAYLALVVASGGTLWLVNQQTDTATTKTKAQDDRNATSRTTGGHQYKSNIIIRCLACKCCEVPRLFRLKCSSQPQSPPSRHQCLQVISDCHSSTSGTSQSSSLPPHAAVVLPILVLLNYLNIKNPTVD